jgi:hypothetical protein
MNFVHPSVNSFFNFPPDHEIPFITIENPFAYVKKVQDEIGLNRQNQSWDQKNLEALSAKLEASTE